MKMIIAAAGMDLSVRVEEGARANIMALVGRNRLIAIDGIVLDGIEVDGIAMYEIVIDCIAIDGIKLIIDILWNL